MDVVIVEEEVPVDGFLGGIVPKKDRNALPCQYVLTAGVTALVCALSAQSTEMSSWNCYKKGATEQKGERESACTVNSLIKVQTCHRPSYSAISVATDNNTILLSSTPF